MKRKITELEKNLIEKGWELDHKTYTGKHSEKTFQYVYEKVYVGEYERNDGKIVGAVKRDGHPHLVRVKDLQRGIPKLQDLSRVRRVSAEGDLGGGAFLASGGVPKASFIRI